MENQIECLETVNILHLPVPHKPGDSQKALKAKRMTIAVGFSCKDGIVLAADTLISTQGSYSYESKIFDIGGPRRFCPVAYSGDVNATKDVREELAAAIADVTDDSQVVVVLKKRIKELHRDLFTKAVKDEKVWLNLLIAVHAHEKWKLYCVDRQHFFSVEKSYQPLGIGMDTGRAVFEPLYRADMTIWEAKFLAIYGLNIIKQYVPGCGGKSQVYLLENGWMSLLGPIEVEKVDEEEDRFRFFETATAPLLLSFAAFGNEFPEGTFDKRFAAFVKQVKAFRKKGMRKAEKRRSHGDQQS